MLKDTIALLVVTGFCATYLLWSAIVGNPERLTYHTLGAATGMMLAKSDRIN